MSALNKSARWVSRTPSPSGSPLPSPRHNVQVYASALFDDMVEDGINEDFRQDLLVVPAHSQQQQQQQRRHSPKQHELTFMTGADDEISPEMRSQIRKQARERRVAQKQKLRAMRARQQKELEEKDRAVREAVQRRIKQKEANFHKQLDALDEEYKEIRVIEEFLDNSDAFEQRKREELYKEWERKVFRPIQKQIEDKLANTTTAEIEARRRKMFEEYLQASNNNQGMFRDIIKPEEYDPLKHAKSVKYSTKGISDPLKKELERIKKEHEEIAELQGLSRKSSSSGKKKKFGSAAATAVRMDPTVWNKLESTPHGRYSRMFSDGKGPEDQAVATAAQKSKANAALRSNVAMDHFSKPKSPQPTSGKRQYAAQHASHNVIN